MLHPLFKKHEECSCNAHVKLSGLIAYVTRLLNLLYITYIMFSNMYV